MFRRILLTTLLATSCTLMIGAVAVHAADDVKKAKTKPVAMSPGEEQVRKGLEAMTSPGAVESVRKSGYGNFYEVMLNNGELIYADETGSFFFTGSLIDMKNKTNVTELREAELSSINFSDLPLSQAIKQVRGNGKRTLVTFEDPNCVYCKKLAKDLQTIKDTTIYTFLIPILSADSGDKARDVWCSADKAKTWNEWMNDGKVPPTANCVNPIASNAELSKKIRIKGTPTLFLADGSRLGGYVSPAELDKAMNDASEKLAKK
ncbi:MAG TPA: DsbC family protein [Rhodocyclaceae bacterium]|nr:DsbC family protein [Rhodocyclaceae bacterium]